TSKVRAVEILTEHFGGLTRESAEAGSRVSSPAVRARVAWSLGRRPVEGTNAILARLAQDPNPLVSLHALEPLGDRPDRISPEVLPGVLKASLPSLDKRVRQASARLASRLPAETWESLWESRTRHPLRSRLTLALASAWRNPGSQFQEELIREALAVLDETSDTELRFEAVRLIELGLGDFHLKDPAVEVVTGYSPAASIDGHEALVSSVGSRLRGFFPTGKERLDEEVARTFAMIEDADPALPRMVSEFWTAQSNPTRDMHYLVVYSRLRASPNPELTPRVARALLALDPKLEGRELRIKQSWNDRLAELVGLLCKHDPNLAEALLSSPDFVSPAHVGLALAIPESDRPRVGRRFLNAARDDSEFAWSGPLIELLANLPTEETRPLLRSQWENYGLRDALLPRLADSPDVSDRGAYLWGLESGQPQVVRAALSALERLPRDDAPEHLAAPLRLLRRLLFEPKEGELRGRVLGLLARDAGATFIVKESSSDPLQLKALYRPVFDELTRRFPGLSGELGQAADEDLAAWERRLSAIDWARGRADRGETLFRARA
ncbi:HEAT repeat domain-containing protein, partial [Singulisphaera rosea]